MVLAVVRCLMASWRALINAPRLAAAELAE
jgi:hypothetical protein